VSKRRVKPIMVAALLLALLFISSCSMGVFKRVEVDNHPKPQTSVDSVPFLDAGCSVDGYGTLSCDPDSPLAALECDLIFEPSDLLGALDPAMPIAECIVEPFSREDWEKAALLIEEIESSGDYFYTYGCLNPQFIRYVVHRDGSFKLLKNEDELRAVFAPVDSANEALAFAQAVTGFGGYFDLTKEPGLRYFVDVLEDTHVDEVDRGYQVLLYQYQFCGCGPHTTSAVDVLVTREGKVEVLHFEPAFEDPEEDDLCID
jgi:hypothetical protein